MNESIPMSELELEIRTWLSADSVQNFDDMYYCRVLGAGNNIRMIGGMYADMADTAKEKGLDTRELLRRVDTINEYFIEKRGQSSYSIIAAIRLMTGDLHEMEERSIDEVCDGLRAAYAGYQARSKAWTEELKLCMWNVIESMDKVLLFDYSSTVNLVMEVAAAHNKKLEVFVPESRILDGGHAYVRNGIAMGHVVHYFPDAALAHFVEKVDAAFIGAETFFPNGGVANTVGSDVTAILCSYFHKALYVPTQLIKVNPLGFKGCGKKILCEDSSTYFGLQLEPEVRQAADMRIAGLVTVPGDLITAFITEEGVVPPAAMYAVSKEYVQKMEQMR